MPRFFNTAGPCQPEKHYMLPAERRLPGIRDLVDQELYFVVHAARQSGKTTCFRNLAESLTAEGRYAALLASCEAGQAASDVDRGIATVIHAVQASARLHLPAELQPLEADPKVPSEARLGDLLTRWARQCPRPIALFLDEIDALRDDILISVLRQLRSGYADRPQNFPASVALIGLRDVRDYRVAVRPDRKTLGTSSPLAKSVLPVPAGAGTGVKDFVTSGNNRTFNVKVESVTLRNFTADEVAELYGQHTAETGQVFTPGALALAHHLTGGQPWLVNALARQAVTKFATDRSQPVTEAVIAQAKEALILRRDTHLDSLIERLREPRVRRVIEPILAGEPVAEDALQDDLSFAKDLGLVVSSPRGLTIANPIYREVIPRALTQVMEESVIVDPPAYLDRRGRLRFDTLLAAFRAFWQQHGEAMLRRAPYSEAAAQLVLMAFLHKVINGGGSIDREYAVGSGRLDLCIRWPSAQGEQRFALEIKVWRDRRKDPRAEGLIQLTEYLRRLGLRTGTLILFDARARSRRRIGRSSQRTVTHKGRKLTVVRL